MGYIKSELDWTQLSLHPMEEFSIQFCTCVCSCVNDHIYRWSTQREVLRILIISYSKMKSHVLHFEGHAQVRWLIWSKLHLGWQKGLILGFMLHRWGNEGKRREVTRPLSSLLCRETFMCFWLIGVNYTCLVMNTSSFLDGFPSFLFRHLNSYEGSTVFHMHSPSICSFFVSSFHGYLISA